MIAGNNARGPLGWLVITITIFAISAAAAPAQTASEEPVAALLSQLREKDPQVRKVAIRRLAQIQDERAVEPLIEILLHDENVEVRRSAAFALGRIRDPRAIQPLIATLQDDHPDLCINVVFALARMEREGEDDNRIEALRIALAHQNPQVCQAAAVGLALLGNKNAVVPLIRSLQDERLTVRMGAAFVLGFLSDRSAVPALLDTLQDDRPVVRRIVIASLGLLGDQRAAPALKRLAAKDPDSEARSRASEALAKLSQVQ